MRQQKRPSISRFEWDDIKAATNWRNHGVAFPCAVKAFRDLFAVEWIDDREDYGEERINLLGMWTAVYQCFLQGGEFQLPFF